MKCSQRFLCPLVFTPEMMIALGSTSPIEIVSLCTNFEFKIKITKQPLMKDYQLKMVDKLRNGNIQCITLRPSPKKLLFLSKCQHQFLFLMCSGASCCYKIRGLAYWQNDKCLPPFTPLLTFPPDSPRNKIIRDKLYWSGVNHIFYHLSNLLLLVKKSKIWCIYFQISALYEVEFKYGWYLCSEIILVLTSFRSLGVHCESLGPVTSGLVLSWSWAISVERENFLPACQGRLWAVCLVIFVIYSIFRHFINCLFNYLPFKKIIIFISFRI